jgi:hypothetical protein
MRELYAAMEIAQTPRMNGQRFLIDAKRHLWDKVAAMTQELIHEVIVCARQLIDDEAG